MKRILIMLLLLSGLSACSKETVHTEQGDKVEFAILPSVAGKVSGEVITRGKVDGQWPAESQIGLHIFAPFIGPSFHPMYNNFMSRYNGYTWGYYLDGMYSGTLLSGFQSWGTIQIYGYHPYDGTVTTLDNPIPFRIADATTPGNAEGTEETALTDYMISEPAEKNMATGVPSITSLEFHHLMTCLEFKAKKVFTHGINSPVVKLSKVKFEIDGTREFTIAGTYKAKFSDFSDIDNNITRNENVQSLSVSYTSNEKRYISSNEYKQSPLVIMPSLRQTTGVGSADDAEITMTFYFLDHDDTPFVFEDTDEAFIDSEGNPVMKFKLSDIDNGAGNDKGLLPGYSYVLEAEIGTYVKFSGAPKIVYENLDENTDGEYIEI